MGFFDFKKTEKETIKNERTFVAELLTAYISYWGGKGEEKAKDFFSKVSLTPIIPGIPKGGETSFTAFINKELFVNLYFKKNECFKIIAHFNYTLSEKDYELLVLKGIINEDSFTVTRGYDNETQKHIVYLETEED